MQTLCTQSDLEAVCASELGGFSRTGFTGSLIGKAYHEFGRKSACDILHYRYGISFGKSPQVE